MTSRQQLPETVLNLRYKELLEDTDGVPRGSFLDLAEGSDRDVLVMLHEVFRARESELHAVQASARNLLHKACESAGFPSGSSVGSNLFRCVRPTSNLPALETFISGQIKQELVRIGCKL
jgi:hypothetical protein